MPANIKIKIKLRKKAFKLMNALKLNKLLNQAFFSFSSTLGQESLLKHK